MATRAEKLRRRQHRKEKKRRRGHDRFEGPVIFHTPPGQVKMSEVLAELVEPEKVLWKDDESIHKVVTMGVAGWNAALLTGNERRDFVETLARTFPPEVRSDFRETIEMYIQRKETLFPHIHRKILDYTLTWRGENPHIMVISEL